MAIEDDDDRAAFCDPDEFGDTAEITLATGAVRKVTGIYLRPFTAVGDGEVRMEAYAPTFVCPTSALAGVAHGTRLTVAGTAFDVVGIEPDGTGMTRLALAEA